MYDFETGDVILRRGQGLSSVVGWFTNSPYTHVGIVYQNVIAIHSYIGGVKPVCVDDLKPFDRLRLKDGFTEREKRKIRYLLGLEMYLDTKYDYFQLVTDSYYSIFGGDNKFNNPRKYICSELIGRTYRKLGYQLSKHNKRGDITPAEIARSPLLEEV